MVGSRAPCDRVARAAAAKSTAEGRDAWRRVLELLRERLPAKTFETWFEPAEYSASDAEFHWVAVPSRLHLDWVEKTYGDAIGKASADAQVVGSLAFFVGVEVPRG